MPGPSASMRLIQLSLLTVVPSATPYPPHATCYAHGVGGWGTVAAGRCLVACARC